MYISSSPFVVGIDLDKFGNGRSQGSEWAKGEVKGKKAFLKPRKREAKMQKIEHSRFINIYSQNFESVPL